MPKMYNLYEKSQINKFKKMQETSLLKFVKMENNIIEWKVIETMMNK